MTAVEVAAVEDLAALRVHERVVVDAVELGLQCARGPGDGVDQHPDHLGRAAHRVAVLQAQRGAPLAVRVLEVGAKPLGTAHRAGVGLGVDGSASNDGNHLLGEARQAMLLQRVGWPGFESSADRFSAREALELATLGGAAVLGRDDIGSLEIGKQADLVAFRIDGIQHAGAQADLVAALLTCTPVTAWLSIINGRVVIEDGQIIDLDLDTLIQQHNEQAKRLLQKTAAA